MLEVVRGFRVLRLAVLPMLQKRVPKITNIVPPRPVPESPHGSFPSVCGLPQEASVAALGTSLPGRRLDQPGRIADKVLYGSGWFLLQRSPGGAGRGVSGAAGQAGGGGGGARRGRGETVGGGLSVGSGSVPSGKEMSGASSIMPAPGGGSPSRPVWRQRTARRFVARRGGASRNRR